MENSGIIKRIDAALDDFVGSSELPENLRDAIRYALLGGGKRLRPLLAWRCAEAVGSPGEAAVPAGVAVELIHAFSLVHDDLPALDDDDLRRGRPTLHRHAGEAMAILAGDAMMTMAYDMLWQAEGLSDGLRVGLVRELGQGTRAMIAGQVYDTLGGLPVALEDREKLELIHRNKTGALIRASCRMGAMLGGADDSELAAITRFAEDLGLIFQIVDDLLDVTASPEAVGKATGKDADAGKLTYPMVLGVDATRREIDRVQTDAETALKPLGHRAGPLLDLSRAMARRDR
ncbi:MAG: polyprenyl synthetase family protein [Phycisphaerales bacterium]|nr:polyprenyl synthetase family protein [Planctomycetota bacterium]MCH8508358.1 polyprenyl synthetase family protein [Phycisphaerales bacterium]